jgi:hypothetical protein
MSGSRELFRVPHVYVANGVVLAAVLAQGRSLDFAVAGEVGTRGTRRAARELSIGRIGSCIGAIGETR